MKKLDIDSVGKKSRKAKSIAHEKEIAKKLGGRVQQRSGAGLLHKGDIDLKDFLLDLKETESFSMLIQGKDLVKITREAFGERKEPGLVLKMRTPMPVPSEWVMIPIDAFLKLLESS